MPVFLIDIFDPKIVLAQSCDIVSCLTHAYYSSPAYWAEGDGEGEIPAGEILRGAFRGGTLPFLGE